MTERQKASEVREPLNDDKWKVHWWNECMRLMLASDHYIDRVVHYSNGTIQLTIKLKPEVIAESSKQ